MQRQSWPTSWLMTDERLGDVLGGAIARAAAAGAGVIVRHHHSSHAVRRAIARKVLASGALLGVSRDAVLAADLGAAFVHNPTGPSGALPFSLSVHHEAEVREAAQRRPAFVFVSPLYATRSHPGAPALGVEEAARLAALAGCPAYALGGVTRSNGEKLIARGWAGWAAIDAWA
ncbi:thiamine phosphate synthase [Sphingomonas kaistensis]|uniref:Thiamine phosphate synthase n=1 Tax=Sphingomonas kaistensis TaxID=298708 RepID=A0ABZ2G0V8_9SPHN